MRKLFFKILRIAGYVSFLSLPTGVFSSIVLADTQTTNLNIGNINLQQIRIPEFIKIDPSFATSFSVFSWITFVGDLATMALVVFWIFLIIRASVKALQSRGEAEGLEEVSKRFKSIFTGMILTFVFPIVLSVIGVILGIGSIFNWPIMFSQCEALSAKGTQYHYYYQAYLDNPNKAVDPQTYADGVCHPFAVV